MMFSKINFFTSKPTNPTRKDFNLMPNNVSLTDLRNDNIEMLSLKQHTWRGKSMLDNCAHEEKSPEYLTSPRRVQSLQYIGSLPASDVERVSNVVKLFCYGTCGKLPQLQESTIKYFKQIIEQFANNNELKLKLSVYLLLLSISRRNRHLTNVTFSGLNRFEMFSGISNMRDLIMRLEPHNSIVNHLINLLVENIQFDSAEHLCRYFTVLLSFITFMVFTDQWHDDKISPSPNAFFYKLPVIFHNSISLYQNILNNICQSPDQSLLIVKRMDLMISSMDVRSIMLYRVYYLIETRLDINSFRHQEYNILRAASNVMVALDTRPFNPYLTSPIAPENADNKVIRLTDLIISKGITEEDKKTLESLYESFDRRVHKNSDDDDSLFEEAANHTYNDDNKCWDWGLYEENTNIIHSPYVEINTNRSIIDWGKLVLLIITMLISFILIFLFLFGVII